MGQELVMAAVTAKAKLGRINAPGFPELMTMLVQFLRHMHESS